MSEWQEIAIEELCSEITDCVNKTAPSVDYVTPYKMIRTTNIKQGRINIDEVRYVTEETYKTWIRRGAPQLEDIILTREAPVGEVGMIRTSEKVFLGQRTMMYRADRTKADPYFLYYAFQTEAVQEQIHSAGMGSVVEHVRVPDAKKFKINTPPLPEQKAIASVLSSLDDKIDLLHRQNKTLEAMAETLFRQWFIEDETLAEVTVSELIEFNPRRSLSKGTNAIYLEMAGLSTQSFNATGYYRREFSSGTKFIQQDTLLARITPCLENGKAGYVTFLNDNEVGWGSTEYIVMHPKIGIHPLMAYVLCRNQDFKDYAESCMEGSSGRQRVNVDHLKEFTIGKPSDEVIQQFNDYLKSIEAKLIYNSKQIQTLENLRNTLLPKLMSGEVSVQYQTEEVA
ncbi:restriction endonuclease subunit S [Acinetobacter pseudolwoffii]|uniref:restriction endonuclease subunit S n=1 Tax=Acinetobacter pseudolwoffii TaxID=2053287 RepID=UPI00246829D9|nr:restriction endonuclease subunit S [Acinetobacter pseudolwoffii]MDH5820006.1 restriction endonuclease subunit S [Acinetobacter pseudolwoffii]